MIETKSQIAMLEKQIAANPVKQGPRSPAPDSAAGMTQQQIADYQRRIADTPAHEEAIAAVNRDYGILSSRYHDLSDLLFQARADRKCWSAGRASV